MICLNITNSSELIASKVGDFVENLTPDTLDKNIVENNVLTKIVESLANKGLRGEISLVKGMDIKNNKLILDNQLLVSEVKVF